MNQQARLTLVAPVRSAGEEFEYFLASLAGQGMPEDAALVLVAYGPDADGEQLTERLRASGVEGHVVTADTDDIALARRAGLDRAEGEWVAFPNPHDALADGSVAALTSAVAERHDIDVFIVPKSRIERGTAPTNRADVVVHPIGDDMAGLPSDISRVVLRRRDVPLTGSALSSYADLLLLLDLLPEQPRTFGFVHGARYLRRPFAGIDPQTEHVREAAEHYRGLIGAIAERMRGEVDGGGWRHRLAMRELFRLVQFENATTKRATVLGGEAGDRFLAELRELLTGFDERLFERVGKPSAFDERRDALLGLRGRDGVSHLAHVVRSDEAAGLVQVRYTRWGESSSESFEAGGLRVQRRYGKRRRVSAFGARVFDQEIAWVPADARLVLKVDGVRLDLCEPDGTPWGESPAAVARDDVVAEAAADDAADYAVSDDAVAEVVPDDVVAASETAEALPNDGVVDGDESGSESGVVEKIGRVPAATRRANSIARRARNASRRTKAKARRAVGRARRSWLSKAAALRAASRLPVVRNRYRDAWLLMDRADLGRDNAEHMYRWLKQNHPEVNAWFVLRADSPDFARLSTEGFRLVEYGSWQHQMLLHNTTQYVSSHVGIDVSRPVFDRYLQKNAPWTFTFLQHGVIHNDLSIWLNRQQIRLFVATTPDEYDGLAGDDSPYVFTDREVRMTGLPRFDKLRRIADAHPAAERKSIVFAPTWRNGLFLPPERPGELRKPKPGFRESPFISSILSVLNDERLRELADEGYEVRFVPHPNLAAHFPYDAIPDFVSVTTYAEADVQELIGTASVFLTDYSSVAFDAAFAGAAVVYMQFDEGAIYGKDHTLAPGYFEFDKHGFGPVTRSVDEALAAVVDGARGGVAHSYAERIRETFPLWDSGACERVYEAITELQCVSDHKA